MQDFHYRLGRMQGSLATTLLAAVLALLSIGVAASEKSHGGEPGAHSGRVIATTPLRRDVTMTRDYVSQIHANRHIEVRALERGYLESVEVTEGQTLEKGQLMFRIQPLTYQAEFRRATAEAEAARIEFENTRELAAGSVVSNAQLALAEARYERAQAELSLAEAHLGFTEIRAPFAGIMDRLELREGSLVEEGDLLTTLSDNSTMWAYFNVPEAEYLDYVADPLGVQGRPVTLVMANGKPFSQPGHVAVIEAEFNSRTGTIPFRADFPNPDGVLRHGQTGNILMPELREDALLVPQKATFETLDQTYVYVIDEGGRVRQQRIVIADELEDVFLVDEGVAETDLLILEGIRSVRDGSVVTFELEDPQRAIETLKTHAE
jgi:membrane fusion protein (multidrug efflux system)